MLTKVFIDILRAIGVAAPRLESLSAVQLSRQYNYLTLSGIQLTAVSRLHDLLIPFSGLHKSFSSVEFFRLGLECRDSDHKDGGTSTLWLTRLLSFMPALQDLSLWFDGTDALASGEGGRPLYAVAGNATASVLQESCGSTLPGLKRFELSNATVPTTSLIGWLKRHVPVLRYLSLRRVSLRQRRKVLLVRRVRVLGTDDPKDHGHQAVLPVGLHWQSHHLLRERHVALRYLPTLVEPFPL